MYLWLFVSCLLIVKPSLEDDTLHEIRQRSVLFPAHSVVQITGGLSVPAILPRRSINLSLGFQINHELPWNLTNFHTVYYGREGLGNLDFDRKTMYEYAINIVEAFGLDGESCLLRTICEVSETPLYTEGDKNDHLLEQILHFLLTPSKDFAENATIHLETSLEHKLLVAERLGRIHGECYNIFKCPISLLDLFTNKYY